MDVCVCVSAASILIFAFFWFQKMHVQQISHEEQLQTFTLILNRYVKIACHLVVKKYKQ
jgi:hypothetical protein